MSDATTAPLRAGGVWALSSPDNTAWYRTRPGHRRRNRCQSKLHTDLDLRRPPTPRYGAAAKPVAARQSRRIPRLGQQAVSARRPAACHVWEPVYSRTGANGAVNVSRHVVQARRSLGRQRSPLATGMARTRWHVLPCNRTAYKCVTPSSSANDRCSAN